MKKNHGARIDRTPGGILGILPAEKYRYVPVSEMGLWWGAGAAKLKRKQVG